MAKRQNFYFVCATALQSQLFRFAEYFFSILKLATIKYVQQARHVAILFPDVKRNISIFLLGFIIHQKQIDFINHNFPPISYKFMYAYESGQTCIDLLQLNTQKNKIIQWFQLI